jgi:hypothetical protein
LSSHLLTLAFIGGHSTAAPGLSVILIALAIGVRFFLYRGRSRGPYGGGGGPYRRGPWGGGPGGGGYGTEGSPEDPPMQWDIRKSPDSGENAATPEPSQAPMPPPVRPPTPTDEQNPPSDL